MEINFNQTLNKFEQIKRQFHGPETTVFSAINPSFFGFLRDTQLPEERVEPMPGIAIEWSASHRLPVVTLDSSAINEDSQLFLQMYGDQLVEI
jgi:hypothetical protein